MQSDWPENNSLCLLYYIFLNFKQIHSLTLIFDQCLQREKIISKLIMISSQRKFYLLASVVCVPLENKNVILQTWLFPEVLFSIPWVKGPHQLYTRDLNQDTGIWVNKDLQFWIWSLFLLPQISFCVSILGGYSPWGRKELYMTEWLSTARILISAICLSTYMDIYIFTWYMMVKIAKMLKHVI